MSVAERLCNQSLLMRGRSPDNILLSGLFITSRVLGTQDPFSVKRAAGVQRWEYPFSQLCWKSNSAGSSLQPLGETAQG